MGFIVEAVIVYQILYTDVNHHLKQYATLKAIGYTDSYLLLVVFQEALILAVLGYLPGFTISLELYTLAQNATPANAQPRLSRLPIAMKINRGGVGSASTDQLMPGV